MSEPSKMRKKKPSSWPSKQCNMELKIITPKGIQYDGEAEMVAFPGVDGLFDVLPSHAPLISALEKGVIRYRVNQKENEITIGGGFVKVENDVLTVCIE